MTSEQLFEAASGCTFHEWPSKADQSLSFSELLLNLNNYFNNIAVMYGSVQISHNRMLEMNDIMD